MADHKLEPCRICCGVFAQSKLLDLFGIDSQIEVLIGIELLKGIDVSKSICTQCNTEFEVVRDFKRKCIESNEFFETKCDGLLKCDVIPKIEEIPLSPAGLSDVSISRDDDDKPLIINEEELDGNDNEPERLPHLPDEKNDGDELSISIKNSGKRKIKNENKPAKRKKKSLDLMNRKQRERHALVCDICGNIFKASHIFALHKRRHSNDKPYVCELCPSKFFTTSELKRHMRRHTGEKPYECQYCHRKFSDYGTHVKHERTHTNDRPFPCQHCGKAFSCGFVLKNHMLTHTGERNYKCTVCNKSFARQHNLTTHEKSIYHQNNILKREIVDRVD